MVKCVILCAQRYGEGYNLPYLIPNFIWWWKAVLLLVTHILKRPWPKTETEKLIFFGYNLEFLHDYPELKKNKTKQRQLTKTSSNNTFSACFNLFWYCFYFFWSAIVVYFICMVVGTNGPWFFNFKNCGKVCLTEKGVLVLNSPE